MKNKIPLVGFICLCLIYPIAINAKERTTNSENSNAESLLESFNKYNLKQKKHYHPSLLTYEKDLIAQGEKNIEYSIEITENEKILYKGNFDLKNSVKFSILTAMNQEDKQSTEVIKKNIEITSEGQKAIEDKKIQSLEIALILHIKKDNRNMYSQFFVEQQNKQIKKEIVAAKAADKIITSDVVTGPDTIKNQDEFVLKHKNNSEAIIRWRDYTFKVIAQIN